MIANIADVAKEAHVAPSTVSNVLNNTKFVSDDIKKRVFAACEKLNYTPNFIASSMRTNRTNILGLFLKSSISGFSDIYHPIIEGVTLTASKYDYNVILYYDIDSRQNLKRLITSGRGPVDGAIMLTPQRADFRMSELKDQNIQYVLIGKPFDDCGGIPYVDVKNDEVAYNSVKLLIEKGRKKILFLNSEAEFGISEDRQKGFKKALSDSGLNPSASLMLNIKTDAYIAAKICDEYFDKYGFDAIIVESDISARGVYDCLKSRGIVIGRDVSVIALGGESVTGLQPKITTYNVNYMKIGKIAVECLIKKIKGMSVEDINNIETGFVSGDSL